VHEFIGDFDLLAIAGIHGEAAKRTGKVNFAMNAPDRPKGASNRTTLVSETIEVRFSGAPASSPCDESKLSS
jgi:hypothetical protein